MSERIEVLRRLQAVDTQLRRLESNKLYRASDVQKKQKQIQLKKAELSNTGEQIKAFRKDVNLKELELKTIEEGINKLLIQMNQVKTNKEYSAIKLEVGGKEADKSVLEDKILSMITQYEEMQQRYTSFEKEIEREESELKELQKRVETDLKVLDKEIVENQEKHKKYADMLDQDTLLQYKRLASHKDAVAVVSVVNKVCQGCFMSVTSQILSQIMSGKDITFCNSCGRILFLDNNEI
ncbi:MAG: C4-type zinc ribbon domain-containing protein [Candidatus Brocadiaceae bacterium]|nr:C4-type zinc ribbon domain-containing protein [Candidatus Brocadiaceae bacterium]